MEERRSTRRDDCKHPEPLSAFTSTIIRTFLEAAYNTFKPHTHTPHTHSCAGTEEFLECAGTEGLTEGLSGEDGVKE